MSAMQSALSTVIEFPGYAVSSCVVQLFMVLNEFSVVIRNVESSAELHDRKKLAGKLLYVK